MSRGDNALVPAPLRRFTPYPAYKDSGIEWLGKIPAHWEKAPLFTVARERNVSNKRGEESNVLSLSYGRIIRRDVTDNFGLMPESFNTYQIVDPGDIVLRLTDLQNDKRSLRAGLVSERGIITSAYVALGVNDRLLPRYAFYLLHAYDVTKVFYALGAGVRQTMKYEDLKWMPLLRPNEAEQRAIAAVLDRETERIDALVVKKVRLVELLEEQRTALITRAVTRGLDPNVPMKDSGVEWLGKIPAQWPVAPMGLRYDVQLGKMLDSSKITGEHLRRYLRVFDVQWGTINTSELPEMDFDRDARERFRLAVGDLLVNEGGSYPGRSAMWQGDIDECYYQKALHRLRALRPREDLPQFLYYLMYWAANQGVFVAGGNETTIEHLPAEKLRRYRFAFPPHDEQCAIASFLDRETARIDTLVAKVRDAIEGLKELRTTLISAAVTGRIDVRGEAA